MATEVNTETGEVTETPEPDATPTPTPDVPEPTPEPTEPPITEEDAREGVDEPEETGPAQPSPRSQKEIDAVLTKCDKASQAYLKKVAEILGDDAVDYFPTPLSEPQIFGFVVRPDLRPLPEDVVNATKALIGEPVPPPLKQAPDSQTCPVCDGWGKVLTGSKVHTKNTDTCRECKGRGWIGERANVTPQEVAAGYSIEADANGHDDEPPVLEDSWGTPIGHPDFGKMPQYRDPGWAEALDAYKRGEPAPVG